MNESFSPAPTRYSRSASASELVLDLVKLGSADPVAAPAPEAESSPETDAGWAVPFGPAAGFGAAGEGLAKRPVQSLGLAGAGAGAGTAEASGAAGTAPCSAPWAVCAASGVAAGLPSAWVFSAPGLAAARGTAGTMGTAGTAGREAGFEVPVGVTLVAVAAC